MHFKKHFLLSIFSISLIFCLGSCSKKQQKIQNFSSIEWKFDKNGCDKTRLNLVDALIKQREILKGWSFQEIIDLLGLPDGNELSKKEEKYYLYFLDAAPACDNFQKGNKTITLKIRFSFRGIVKELSIEKR